MVHNVRLHGVDRVEELAAQEAHVLQPARSVQGHVSFLQLGLRGRVRYVYVYLK